MDKGQNCNEFRKQYRGDESTVDVLSAEQKQHLSECSACKKWTVEINDIAQKSALPQFDVPEKLTQNIMSAVAAQASRPVLSTQLALLIPLSAAGIISCFVLVPLDNLEGYGASVVAIGILVLINLFIRSDSKEDAAVQQ